MADPDVSKLLRGLSLDDFPSTMSIRPRWGDLDMLRHLNNVAIADYYYDVRVRFLAELSTGDSSASRLLVRRLELDYLGEGSYDHDLHFGTGVLTLGRTSVTIGTAMHQDGRCIGACLCVLVATGEGGTIPLSAGLRTVLEERLLGR